MTRFRCPRFQRPSRVVASDRRMRGGLFRAVATTTTVTVAITALGGITGVVGTRALGPYQRGLLATAVVWSGVLVSVLAVAGPDTATYFGARRLRERAQFASSALAVSAVIGTALAVAGVVASALLGGPARTPLVIAFAATLPLTISGAGVGTVLGAGQIRRWGILRILNPLIGFVGVVVAVSLGWRVASAIATVTATAAVVQCGAVLMALHRRRLLARPTRVAVRQIISYGWRNLVGLGAWWISYKLDQLVLSIAVTSRLLGLYSVAASFGEIIVPVASSAGIVMLARVSGGGRDEVRASLSYAIASCLLVAGVIAGVFFVTAPWLVPLLFGHKFAGCIPSMRILLPGALALATSSVLSGTLRGLGRPLVPAVAEGVGAACTGILLLLLVPSLGIRGAAIASTVSYTVVALCMAALLRREMRLAPPSVEPGSGPAGLS